MSKIKKYTTLCLSLILLSAALYGIAYYFSFFQGNYTVNNGKIVGKNLPTTPFNSHFTPENTFSTLPINKIDTISIYLLGNKLDTNMLKKGQRIYVPLSTISKSLNYSQINSTNEVILSNGLDEITISDNYFIHGNNTKTQLRGNLISYNDTYYISISDIEEIFNLIASFDYNNQQINITNYELNLPSYDISTNSNNGKVAMIRLEDFTSGSPYNNEENISKLKSIALLMKNEGMKYHIAWIPRYKLPANNIDNDLLTNDSFSNIAFINALDYLINHNALVGLHGYTHQSDNEESGIGSELSSNANTSEAETRAVIENAINTSVALNIPIAFFESPHYHSTSSQKKIVEEYFQYIYEPRNYLIYNKVSLTQSNNLYIPTPLSYLSTTDATPITKKLNNLRSNELASFFYHPKLEFEYINTSLKNNTLYVNYSEDSPLNHIIKTLKENGYTPSYINNFIK